MVLLLDQLEFGVLFFCGGRKTGEPREKISEQGENKQQNQPNIAPDRNRPRTKLVGGERSHHCAIPAPHIGSRLVLWAGSGLKNVVEIALGSSRCDSL